MKKLIALLMALIMMMSAFTAMTASAALIEVEPGQGNVTEAEDDFDDTVAQGVIDIIAVLVDEITSLDQADDIAAVEAAREAYDALTEDQQGFVTNIEKLTTLEEQIAALEKAAADQAAAAAVDKMIEDLGEITSLDQVEDVEAVWEAYEALTKDQQALVTKLEALCDADDAIAALEDAAAAAAVDKMIEDLGEITLEKEEAVVAAREAYDDLTETQAALVKNLETLVAAEATIEELKNPSAPEYPAGDVDMTGVVDVADIMKLKALIMADKWTDEELSIGDMNASGALDVGDIMEVKSIIMSA